MDPKKILGVEANATPEQIRRAYREKAKKHHPDIGGDAWAFQQVQDAYQALTNSDSESIQTPNRHPTPTQSPQSGGSNESIATGKTRRQPRDSSDSSDSTSRPQHSSQSDVAESSQSSHNWQNLFSGQLPLQTETTTFILVNCLDIFVTYILLTKGAMEANPIANYFMQQWGFAGAIGFKLAIVAFVTVIAQIVAIKNMKTARTLLIAGTIIVGCVVIYSIALHFKHY